jgi:hypothetical protein
MNNIILLVTVFMIQGLTAIFWGRNIVNKGSAGDGTFAGFAIIQGIPTVIAILFIVGGVITVDADMYVQFSICAILSICIYGTTAAFLYTASNLQSDDTLSEGQEWINDSQEVRNERLKERREEQKDLLKLRGDVLFGFSVALLIVTGVYGFVYGLRWYKNKNGTPPQDQLSTTTNTDDSGNQAGSETSSLKNLYELKDLLGIPQN